MRIQHVLRLSNMQGHDLTAAPASQQYMAAFYWMLISTLTIGYGDISAATPLEQGAVVAAVITGVLFIGYAIKGITDVMAEAAVQVRWLTTEVREAVNPGLKV
jgi:hypothetical protein